MVVVRESAVPEGVIMTTPSEFAMEVMAEVQPEVAEPTTSWMPSEIRAFIALTHSVESPWSSLTSTAS